MTVFCLCLMGLFSDWHFEESEVFGPLRTSEVIVRGDGQIYVLRFEKADVLQLDNAGKPVRSIGGKGMGPGEFRYPTRIFYRDKQLLVYDLYNQSVSCFDDRGVFQNRFKIPHPELVLVSSVRGWIYGNWGNGGLEGKPAVLKADFQFEHTQPILPLKGRAYLKGQSSGRVINFCPLKVKPILLEDHRGELVFFSETETFRIVVIDAVNGRQLRTIKRPEKPLPFDEEWGREKMAKIKSRPGFKIRADFPDYFPVIRNMRIDPDGNLAVDRWRGRPDGNHHSITLDRMGKQLKRSWSWASLDRVVGVVGNKAVVTTYDEEQEQAGLISMPLAAVEGFVRGAPIHTSPKGRYILMD